MTVLTLSRRAGERIAIGSNIELTIVEVSKGRVKVAICAPRGVAVHRGELVDKVVEQNLRALEAKIDERAAAGDRVVFPEGLYGLRGFREFVIAENEGPLSTLVACGDAATRLTILDAAHLGAAYPIEEAGRIGAPGSSLHAVALVAHFDEAAGSLRANRLAPIVIDVGTRIGVQILLEGHGFGVSDLVPGSGAPVSPL